MFEFVENDTLPILYASLTEDDGVTPIGLSGYTITLHIGYTTPLVKDATITDLNSGQFSFVWVAGDLRVGTWAAEIQIISPEGKKTVQKSIDNVPLRFIVAKEIA